MGSPKITNEQVLELYAQGLSNSEIAHDLGVTEAAIYYRLEKFGLLNNIREGTHPDPGNVKALHSLGLTTIGIAIILETNSRTINEILDNNGLDDNAIRLKQILELPVEEALDVSLAEFIEKHREQLEAV